MLQMKRLVFLKMWTFDEVQSIHTARPNTACNGLNGKLFAQACGAKKKACSAVFLCQISTLSHSAPSHLSVNPLVARTMGVAGAESRAIGISLCPTTIISFALTTHLLFTFTPEMGEAGSAFHRGSGKSRRWWTWKWASFPPSLSEWEKMWCHILSELGSWPGEYSGWNTSTHFSASDLRAKRVEQAGERYPTRQYPETCSNYQKSAKTYTDADVSMVTYAENCNDDTQFSFIKPWKNILYFIYIHFYPEINVCIFERSVK